MSWHGLRATQEAASGMWRSEDMCMVQMHMQREVAHPAVLGLGSKGIAQFVDLNKEISAFQRDFSADVRRCDDMERKLRYLEEEVDRSGITFVTDDGVDMEMLHTLERKIDKHDHDVRELTGQFESLVLELNRTREHLEVLKRDLLGDLSSLPEMSGHGLNMICGVMPKSNVDNLQRLIYRTTRGNSVVHINDIAEPFENPLLNEEVIKCVFVVFFSAQRLQEKLKKICDVSGATVYPYIESRDELTKTRAALHARHETISTALCRNANVRKSLLSTVATSLTEWKRAVLTEKSVFTQLNLFQFKGPTVVAQGWVPVAELDLLEQTIQKAEKECGAQVATVLEVLETKETKPTFFRTSKYTSIFQGIVDSYGMGRYKEANPGVFTVVTFPYLFGVMYGDIGHGIMLTIIGAILLLTEHKFEGKPMNEILAMVYGGRYLLFAMGLFATYLGVLYNDMFGMSTEIFSTGYIWPALPPDGKSGVVHPMQPNGNPSVKPTNTVAFGIDSAWGETENKLEVYNSIKMKCAVIIGIIQMSVGILISLTNHIYYKDWKSVYFRFIPEIVFLTCTFGYMALMIIIKWVTPWENTNLAPSLLETMTNFFLAPGDVRVPLYGGQAGIQLLLLFISFSMVPVLLLGIPYVEYKANEEREKRRGLLEGDDADAESDDGEHGGHGGHGGKFDFSEIMIHQIIHTIEFVLGCVSNTASYLRLWALSLAHAQLSEVFWNFSFMAAVGADDGGGVTVFIGLAVWLSATVCVLLMMESLSAFLHALRLHWVEFQSKFYYGDGVPFLPFDLGEALSGKV